MINFFKHHKHLYAMLTPVILGLIFLGACIPAINRPITFNEADALTNIFHSHAWGLRMIAPVLMCIILVITFQVIKYIGGLKIATIASVITVAVFTGGVYLKNIPTPAAVALPNIIADIRQYDPEPQTIYFDIPEFNAAMFYDTPEYPIADLGTRPTGDHHFWLVVPFEKLGDNLAESASALDIPDGYYVANQLGNDYYAAVDLTPVDSELIPTSSD